MNKFNLLSRAEMKLALGGNTEIGVIGGEGKDCVFAICAYRGPDNEWVSGYCGSSTNGEQCRCIAQNGLSSIPFSGCLA